MTSKGVMDRQRWAKALIAIARAHAAEVGDHLRQHFAQHFADASPDGGAHPDFTLVHIQLARALELRLAEMVGADERHLAERDDDRDARRRRAAAAEEVHRQIIELRSRDRPDLAKILTL